MSKDEKENRINSLALTFLERQQIRPNIFADQIIRGYKEGYLQAEKDLELGWEDIWKIDDVVTSMSRKFEWQLMSVEQFYKEALKRFKENRK